MSPAPESHENFRFPSVFEGKPTLTGMRNLRTFGWALVPLFTLFILGPFAFIDFDPHHDGLMIAGAIGVRDGKVAHLQVFGQYGPLAMWSQAIFASLPIGEALALKLWSVFHVSLVATLVAEMWRVLPIQLGVTPAISRASAMIWLLSSDVLLNSYMLPWSSLQAATLICAAMWAILRVFNGSSSKRSQLAHLALAGAFLALSPFSRINVGIAAWGVVIFAFLISIAITRNRWLRAWVPFWTGFSGTLGLVLGVLHYQGSLAAFWQQSVLGPAEWARSAVRPDNWNTFESLWGLFLESLPALVLSFSFVVALGLFRSAGSRFAQKSLLLWALVSSAGLLVLIFDAVDDVSRLVNDWDLPALYDLLVEVKSGEASFLYAQFFAGVIASLALLVRSAFATESSSEKGTFAAFLLAGLNLALAVQVVPTWDPRHVWWGMPLSCLTIVVFMRAWEKMKNLNARPLVFIIAVMVLPQIISGVNQLLEPRASASGFEITRGMYVREGIADYLREVDRVYQLMPKGDDLRYHFLVSDGAVSVFEGSYVAEDENFVWWANSDREFPGKFGSRDVIVVDEFTRNHHNIESWSVFENGAELQRVGCEGRFCVFTALQ